MGKSPFFMGKPSSWGSPIPFHPASGCVSQPAVGESADFHPALRSGRQVKRSENNERGRNHHQVNTMYI